MAVLWYASAAFSTLFRLAAYIFLRVIPVRVGRFVLPALFSAYLSSTLFAPPPPREFVKWKKSEGDFKQSTRESPKSFADSLRAIIFSLPSTRNLKNANLAINSLLLLGALEFGLYPFLDTASDVVFTRVGAVYPDAVKIVVRYPSTNASESDLRVVWRETKGNSFEEVHSWIDGPVVSPLERNDWVDTVKLSGLWPRTTYEYRLASMNKTILPYPDHPISFKTFPDPRLARGTHFRFVVSSCLTPNFPYVPLQGRTIKGFDLLDKYLFPSNSTLSTSAKAAYAELQGFGSKLSGAFSSAARTTTVESESLESLVASATSAVLPSSTPSAAAHPTPPPAEFLMLLGDFIYADVPVYIGDDQEAYRRLYRRNHQSKSYRKIYEKLPVFHTYDDHEIINNFAGQANDSTPPFPNASEAFKIYNSDANYDSKEPGQHYYDFRYGDVAFFVMDTRRHRSDVFSEDIASKTMLGDKQLAALYDWLGKVNNTATFKFIATSVPLTSLWGHDAQSDSWAGFTAEKTSLLNALHSVPNVIVLSGDRHEFAAVEFNGEDERNPIWEFSTSPLSMFYVPFFRTLGQRSAETVQRVKSEVVVTDGVEQNVTTTEEVPRENVVKYIPKGNYKWSTLEVDTRDLENPVVRLEVVIDGSVAYRLNIHGSPAKLSTSQALGVFVPGSLRSLLEKIGIKTGGWF